MNLKIEALDQKIKLIEWVQDGCPPIDLNTLSLGIRETIDENCNRGLCLKKCLFIIDSSKVLMREDNKVKTGAFIDKVVEKSKVRFKKEQ